LHLPLPELHSIGISLCFFLSSSEIISHLKWKKILALYTRSFFPFPLPINSNASCTCTGKVTANYF
jgi:hypothetical protein